MQAMQSFIPNKSSRSIDDLAMPVAKMALDHIHACKLAGIDLLVTQTYRCPADQHALYCQGRTAPGKIVTNADAGESTHQYRLAYDVVPMRNGKPVWGTKEAEDIALWRTVGDLGKSCGLEWAGDWKRFKEYPHFQYTGGLSIADFKAGKMPTYPRGGS